MAGRLRNLMLAAVAPAAAVAAVAVVVVIVVVGVVAYEALRPTEGRFDGATAVPVPEGPRAAAQDDAQERGPASRIRRDAFDGAAAAVADPRAARIVEATDDDGRPTPGRRVRLFAGTEESRGTTGADGRATLLPPRLGPDDADAPLVADFAFPYVGSDAAEELEDAVGVLLRTPPTGEVRVRCVDAAGRATTFPGDVTVEADRSRAVDARGAAVRVAARGDAAVVVEVGVGTPLLVSVVAADAAGARRLEIRCDGPDRVGARVDVEFALPAPGRTIGARVLRPDGVPFVLTNVAVSSTDAAGEPLSEPRNFATDVDGRLDVEFDGPFPPAPPGGSVVYEVGLDDRTPFRGVVAAPERGGGARVDLGDVRLTRVRPLAAGRVVDAAGEPVAGARLQCKDVVGAAADPAAPRLRARDVRIVQPRDDGAFKLYGPARPGRLSIEARIERVAEAYGSCVYDGSGAELALTVRGAGGALAGRIEAPGLELRSSQVRVRRRDGGAQRFEVSTAVRPDGTFDFGRVPTGTYDTELAHPDALAPLRLADGVVVADARPTVDPRLNPARPPFESRVYRFEPVDGVEPFPLYVVSVDASGADYDRLRSYRFDNAPRSMTLVVSPDAPDFRIESAEGVRFRSRTLPRGGGPVRLEAPYLVELELRENVGATQPNGRRPLPPRLRNIVSGDEYVGRTSSPSSPRVWTLPEPGFYDVVVAARTGAAEKVLGRIEVADRDEPQRFKL